MYTNNIETFNQSDAKGIDISAEWTDENSDFTATSKQIIDNALNVERRSRLHTCAKDPSRRYSWVLITSDILVICLCFAVGRLANWITNDITFEESLFGWHANYGNERVIVFCVAIAACITAFTRFGHYSRRRPFWQELGDILAVVITVAVLDAALVFLTKSDFSRLWWGTSWVLVAAMLPTARYIVKRMLLARGAWIRPTVIVGTGPNALDAAEALENEPLFGFKVIAFIKPQHSEDHHEQSFKIIGRTIPIVENNRLAQLLKSRKPPHVVIALELNNLSHSKDYIENFSHTYNDISIMSPLRGLPLTGASVTRFFSNDILALRFQNNLERTGPEWTKRAFDILIASLLVVLLLPVFAILGWLVAQTGKPILYGHQRIGRRGRPFNCVKFRTMKPNADRILSSYLTQHPELKSEWERNHKLRDDPRVTTIGSWLRRTSLDELPQLFNVVRGEMSLVGPRPIVAEELPMYGSNAYHYLQCRPGITGLWQVSGRSDTTFGARARLDGWYARNWSLWCDFYILLKTPRVVFSGGGAY